MKIGIAQTHPFSGDIKRNIDRHLSFAQQAADQDVDLIIFPELSLTGYEPSLAYNLACTPDDPRLNIFQKLSDSRQIRIGVGLPTKHPTGICISLTIFQPKEEPLLYSKKYLHADELPFFVSGDNFPVMTMGTTPIAFAICYEISIEEHVRCAVDGGAQVYIASVAKFESGVQKAKHRLATIAKTHGLLTLMANSIGPADGQECAGQSAVWNNEGRLLGQLDTSREGMLIVDTESEGVFELDQAF